MMNENIKDLDLINSGTFNQTHTIHPIGDENKMDTTILQEDVEFDPIFEADNTKPEYNTDMSPEQAKRTLGTLSAQIINDSGNVTQYTANIYANIITKNLLPIWAKGYRKISIQLDSKQTGNTFEFRVPVMTMDFISRFTDGRESIQGFLHRTPEIKIKMSPNVFKTMNDRNDAFNFFRDAIKYYNVGVEKYSDKIIAEILKLPREMKRLISTSKLSGLVSAPIQMLFSFDDVAMSNRNTFVITKTDITTVTSFIHNIYTKYAAPEKEKTKIIEDLTAVIDGLRKNTELTENAQSILSLPSEVKALYTGQYSDIINESKESFYNENVDYDTMGKADMEVKLMYEKFGVKKLKKIPRDLVAYISIETESIKDANDKMMIASYCLSKLEIVEWYIELLEVGSKKYIVPHSRPYLETIRTQLLQCYKNIMAVKIKNPNDRPLIDVRIPGYEG